MHRGQATTRAKRAEGIIRTRSGDLLGEIQGAGLPGQGPRHIRATSRARGRLVQRFAHRVEPSLSAPMWRQPDPTRRVSRPGSAPQATEQIRGGHPGWARCWESTLCLAVLNNSPRADGSVRVA